tara:strand:+ start:519 stop:662 length:144 start_codon:yes stop_codon:yes gene_type:complete
MTKIKTISFEEHFILVEYYKNKIQELQAKLQVQARSLQMSKDNRIEL